MAYTTKMTRYSIDQSDWPAAREWALTLSNHAQFITVSVGDTVTCYVTITDYTAPAAIVTDRAVEFAQQFGSAQQEQDHA